jgi:hypothetical protein
MIGASRTIFICYRKRQIIMKLPHFKLEEYFAKYEIEILKDEMINVTCRH